MPKPHKYTDWHIGRLKGSKPVYIAENSKPVTKIVQVNSKTYIIKH
jgi:hypothetical protein